MFETQFSLVGDLARRIEREARLRDMSPEEVVAELLALAFAAQEFARKVKREASLAKSQVGEGP